jgi:hypothetical protein
MERSFVTEPKIQKSLEKLRFIQDPKEKLKLLYEWTKTGYLNRREFSCLVEVVGKELFLNP